jgi:hypothetical protein
MDQAIPMIGNICIARRLDSLADDGNSGAQQLME